MEYNSNQTEVRDRSKGGVLKRWKSFFYQLSGAALHQPRFPIQQVAFSYISSFIGIAALAYLSVNSEYPLIAAPFGATAVLAYGVPSSPLAQPRNIIGGNFMGAISGIVAFQLFGEAPWVMALAVATAIKLMQLTKTVHPPGGAVALVSVMSHASWTFLGTPILVGSIIIVLWTYAFCKIVPGRPYPRHWF